MELNIGILIITFVRLLVPLTIFRWQFMGVLLSLVADNLDWFFFQFKSSNDYIFYQRWDKLMDMYFYIFMLMVSLSWRNTALRITSVALFIYRLIGFFIFEIAPIGTVFLIFPNLFQSFYFFVATAVILTKKEPSLSIKQLATILSLLLVPTLIVEYSTHIINLMPWDWPVLRPVFYAFTQGLLFLSTNHLLFFFLFGGAFMYGVVSGRFIKKG